MTVANLSKICRSSAGNLPPLEAGDALNQQTFHERYRQTPPHIKAELIGGTVYMPAAVGFDHADVHGELMFWLKAYKSRTPGVRALDNATDILGHDSQPQPDASLIIEGGQTRLNDERYVVGPPELVIEVASSSVSYDLHAKREDYERYGIGEYLVLLVWEKKPIWFVRESGKFVEQSSGPDGILRSRIFPGLWLDAAALLRGDTLRVEEVLKLGLATPEHAAFAAERAKPRT
jgi:Uma2 family endonuclease